MNKVKPPMAWSWRFEDGSLCFWAEPTKEMLLMRGKPSDDAIPVCLRLVPYKDYHKLLTEAGW